MHVFKLKITKLLRGWSFDSAAESSLPSPSFINKLTCKMNSANHGFLRITKRETHTIAEPISNPFYYENYHHGQFIIQYWNQCCTLLIMNKFIVANFGVLYMILIQAQLHYFDFILIIHYSIVYHVNIIKQ